MSAQEGSDTGFRLALSAGALGLLAITGVGSLLLFAGIAGGIVAMLLAMMPGDPVLSVALDPGTSTEMAWTEGPHAQELWLEVDLSHHFESPWLDGELLVDGLSHPVSFSGDAVLAGESSKMTANWRSDGDHVQGWTRVMKLDPSGTGSEHQVRATLNPGENTTPRILRLHIVDCDNWSCDPDRLF
ncbi:MAG: hypothetical protein ACI9VR_003203 [Cognaticolwellia sp.]|jgi:hypothetical protein